MARGQSDLLHESGRKGLFTAIPVCRAGPEISTTLQLVPLGPGLEASVNLSLLARVEFFVVETIRVVVAPVVRNQLPLSSFS